MNNLIKIVLLFALASFTGLCSAVEAGADSGIECVKNSFTEDELVKIHGEQKRFFFVMEPFQQEKMIDAIRTITVCLKRSCWEKRWSLSVFSDKKYAGYKDEPEIIQFHNNNLWSKGYRAEYDSQSHRLTLNPALEPVVVPIHPDNAGQP